MNYNYPLDFSELNSDTFIYKLLDEGDFSLYAQLFSSAEVMKFIAAPLEREKLDKSFANAISMSRQYPFERLFITINCLLSKRAIGIAGFTLHSDGSGKAIEFGVMLIPDYQGQGIAASITLNAVNWIFSSLNIQRVIVEIDGLNIAARKTAEKVGFQPSENDPRFYILTANY